MTDPQTLPQHWLQNVHRYWDTDKVAVRQKEFGIWQRFTWRQEYEQVKDFSLGLVDLGLRKGDRVAIIGDNSREYLWGALAVMAAGAAVVGMFTDVRPNEIEYIVTHSDARFVLASDQEQCDKLLDIKDKLPDVKHVIYWDDRGMWNYNEPWLLDFTQVQALGRVVAEQNPQRFDECIAEGQGSDLAMICYTSGTTGLPKGVMIAHSNFLYSATALSKIDPRYPTDNYVSFIPMAWIGGAVLDIAPHTVEGVILNFTEGPETVQQNIREIAPDALLYNSRLWENLVATIQVRIQDSIWIYKQLYRLFLPIGYKIADLRFEKKPVPLHLKLLYQLGKWAIFEPLLSQFGLHRARSTYTSGAALSPDVIRFFAALGLALRQVYGATELTGGAVAHRADDIKFESVGKPIPGAAMQISESGEIYLTSPGLFQGYHKNPEATAKSIYVDDTGKKWFKTGDAGYIDEDGHLIYLDRMKDMIELATGEKYSPQFIEGRLKFSPYISHAMTIGGQDKEYVSALITIDFDNVGHWAERHGIAYTTYTDLSQKPEVYELVRRDVENVNRSLPKAARVRKFVLMHKAFDADEGEMTRTRKLRRLVLQDRYREIVDALYQNLSEVQIKGVVKYQDGREAFIDTSLRIAALEETT